MNTAGYDVDVCYAGLSCTITTEDCINGGKLCVSRLSDTTNARLAECGSSGYDLNLCCSGGSNS